jgi:hypothetical protein
MGKCKRQILEIILSLYAVSNGRVISELQMGQDIQASSSGLI